MLCCEKVRFTLMTKFPLTLFSRKLKARCWARNGTGWLRGSFKAFANLLLISLLQPAGRARLAGREAVRLSCGKGLPPPPGEQLRPGQRGTGHAGRAFSNSHVRKGQPARCQLMRERARAIQKCFLGRGKPCWGWRWQRRSPECECHCPSPRIHFITFFFRPLLVSAFQSPVGLQKGEMQMPQIWKKYSHGQFRLGFSSEGWSCVSDNTAPTQQ